jgi:hypothetical protein
MELLDFVCSPPQCQVSISVFHRLVEGLPSMYRPHIQLYNRGLHNRIAQIQRA